MDPVVICINTVQTVELLWYRVEPRGKKTFGKLGMKRTAEAWDSGASSIEHHKLVQSSIILAIKFIRVQREMTGHREDSAHLCVSCHISASVNVLHPACEKDLDRGKRNRYAVSCVVKRRYINAKFKRKGNMRSNV